MKHLEKLITTKFPKLRIAIIGDVMVDSYLFGNADRISPEAPVPVVNINGKEFRPGGAANVALNLKTLGVKPILFSVIGKDNAGKKLINLLNEAGIGVKNIIASNKRITTLKTRLLSNNHQMIRFDEEMQHDISDSEADTLYTLIVMEIQAQKFDAVIIEDYNKGVLSDSFIEVLMNLFSEKNIPVLVDPKKNNFFSYYKATVFKPNLREAREALGKNFNTTIIELNQVHEDLVKKFSHQCTFITLGDKGAYINDGKSATIIPAQIRNVADVSGAGDTVIAVMAAAISAGANFFDAAFLSNLAGGLVCEKPGVAAVSKQDLLKGLKNKME